MIRRKRPGTVDPDTARSSCVFLMEANGGLRMSNVSSMLCTHLVILLRANSTKQDRMMYLFAVSDKPLQCSDN